jgi:DNA-binding Xre family transcriptional regulator
LHLDYAPSKVQIQGVFLERQTKMMTVDEVRLALAKRQTSDVSLVTGMHRNVIDRIKNGENKNPTYYTLSKLSDYLEASK